MIFMIIVKGTLSISMYSLRIPFCIEFGPTALQVLFYLLSQKFLFLQQDSTLTNLCLSFSDNLEIAF